MPKPKSSVALELQRRNTQRLADKYGSKKPSLIRTPTAIQARALGQVLGKRVSFAIQRRDPTILAKIRLATQKKLAGPRKYIAALSIPILMTLMGAKGLAQVPEAREAFKQELSLSQSSKPSTPDIFRIEEHEQQQTIAPDYGTNPKGEIGLNELRIRKFEKIKDRSEQLNAIYNFVRNKSIRRDLNLNEVRIIEDIIAEFDKNNFYVDGSQKVKIRTIKEFLKDQKEAQVEKLLDTWRDSLPEMYSADPGLQRDLEKAFEFLIGEDPSFWNSKPSLRPEKKDKLKFTLSVFLQYLKRNPNTTLGDFFKLYLPKDLLERYTVDENGTLMQTFDFLAGRVDAKEQMHNNAVWQAIQTIRRLLSNPNLPKEIKELKTEDILELVNSDIKLKDLIDPRKVYPEAYIPLVGILLVIGIFVKMKRTFAQRDLAYSERPNLNIYNARSRKEFLKWRRANYRIVISFSTHYKDIQRNLNAIFKSMIAAGNNDMIGGHRLQLKEILEITLFEKLQNRTFSVLTPEELQELTRIIKNRSIEIGEQTRDMHLTCNNFLDFLNFFEILNNRIASKRMKTKIIEDTFHLLNRDKESFIANLIRAIRFNPDLSENSKIGIIADLDLFFGELTRNELQQEIQRVENIIATEREIMRITSNNDAEELVSEFLDATGAIGEQMYPELRSTIRLIKDRFIFGSATRLIRAFTYLFTQVRFSSANMVFIVRNRFIEQIKNTLNQISTPTFNRTEVNNLLGEWINIVREIEGQTRLPTQPTQQTSGNTTIDVNQLKSRLRTSIRDHLGEHFDTEIVQLFATIKERLNTGNEDHFATCVATIERFFSEFREGHTIEEFYNFLQELSGNINRPEQIITETQFRGWLSEWTQIFRRFVPATPRSTEAQVVGTKRDEIIREGDRNARFGRLEIDDENGKGLPLREEDLRGSKLEIDDDSGSFENRVKKRLEKSINDEVSFRVVKSIIYILGLDRSNLYYLDVALKLIKELSLEDKEEIFNKLLKLKKQEGRTVFTFLEYLDTLNHLSTSQKLELFKYLLELSLSENIDIYSIAHIFSTLRNSFKTRFSEPYEEKVLELFRFLKELNVIGNKTKEKALTKILGNFRKIINSIPESKRNNGFFEALVNELRSEFEHLLR